MRKSESDRGREKTLVPQLNQQQQPGKKKTELLEIFDMRIHEKYGHFFVVVVGFAIASDC